MQRVLIAAGLGFALAGQAVAAGEKPANQELSIDSPAGRATLPVVASHALLGRLPGVTRLVVMVGGDAGQALALGRAALGPEAAHSLVVAPEFLTAAEAKRRSLPGDRLRWAGDGWADGLPAAGPRPVSPFSALDSLLRILADRGLLPDLKSVVLAGQEDGADLVQLYAMVTTHLDGLQKRGIALRFVLAAPRHYLYLDTARPVPADAASCPGFNRWPYGLDGAPDYLDELGPASIFAQYRARDVVYLLGDGGGAAEPGGCAAAAQGADGTARGRFYAAYMAKLARAPIQKLAVLAKADAAHGLLASSCGAAALLDGKDCPALAAAPDVPAFPGTAAKPEPAKAAAAPAAPETPKPGTPKPDAPKPDAAKPDAAKPAPAPAGDTPAAAPSPPAPKTEALPPPGQADKGQVDQGQADKGPAAQDQPGKDQPKSDQAAPGDLPDPLQDANPIGPLLTRPNPPQPKPAPPRQ